MVIKAYLHDAIFHYDCHAALAYGDGLLNTFQLIAKIVAKLLCAYIY